MTETWTVKKPAVYCRPHGLKIEGFLNGIGLCQKCLKERAGWNYGFGCSGVPPKK